jgi:hypothetical protein
MMIMGYPYKKKKMMNERGDKKMMMMSAEREKVDKMRCKCKDKTGISP